MQKNPNGVGSHYALLTCDTCGKRYEGRSRASRGQTRYFCSDCGRPKGARAHAWKGGFTWDSGSGRWYVNCRDGSRILYYRALMEAELRRPLLAGEAVHHINGDCSDDRVENLQVMSHADHVRLHRPWSNPEKQGKLTWADVREIRCLLAGGVRVVEVASRFRVTAACIYMIRRGDTWRES